jgi:hypothetical protein
MKYRKKTGNTGTLGSLVQYVLSPGVRHFDIYEENHSSMNQSLSKLVVSFGTVLSQINYH